MQPRRIRPKAAGGLVAMAALLLMGTAARAEVIYESATTTFTGETPTGGSAGGVQTDQEFWSGVRFFLDRAVIAEAIGGHFTTPVARGNDQIFGVIAAIESGLDVPDLDTDVVAQTLLTLPTPGTSADIKGGVSALLQPGWYALVFGSGRYGATSELAGAIKSNADGPVNQGIDLTFAIRVSDNVLIPQTAGARYFLEGREVPVSVIPEPGSMVLMGLGLVGAGLASAARRRRLARA
jgi:hypothetical protein